MKNCIICNKEQELSEYYKHKEMADGHLNKCKTCCKLQNKEREEKLRKNPEWVEKEKIRAREKYNRLGYKDKHKPTTEEKKYIMERYTNKYPEKAKAKYYTHLKVEAPKGMHRHHWSYNEEHWLDVFILDELTHNKVHRYMAYDQEYMMYRDNNNELLDSREKHEFFINSLKDMP